MQSDGSTAGANEQRDQLTVTFGTGEPRGCIGCNVVPGAGVRKWKKLCKYWVLTCTDRDSFLRIHAYMKFYTLSWTCTCSIWTCTRSNQNLDIANVLSYQKLFLQGSPAFSWKTTFVSVTCVPTWNSLEPPTRHLSPLDPLTSMASWVWLCLVWPRDVISALWIAWRLQCIGFIWIPWGPQNSRG